MKNFFKFLETTYAFYGLNNPEKNILAAWQKLFTQFGGDRVQSAISLFCRKSKYVPRPIDVYQILNDDGRPSADEAWAIAIRSFDENLTIRWTTEIAKARGEVRELFETDEVGARMAFREIYARLVDEARIKGEPAQWEVSLGLQQREDFAKAAQIGYETKKIEMDGFENERRVQILKIKDFLAEKMRPKYAENPDVARTRELKRQQAQRFKEFGK